MASFGALKFCACLVPFMWIIFHIEAALTSREARTLDRKLDLMKTGFDSKLLDAVMDIEDLRLSGTCKCQEANMTDTEHTVESAVQKNTNTLEDNDKQTIRDDVARLTTGLMSEKQARKVFEQKTDGLIQQKSKSQHKKINKLKNIVDIMKNTIGQQRDKINHLSEDNIGLKTSIALQQETIDSLAVIVSDMASSFDWMKKSIQRCPEPASFNHGKVKYDGTSIGSIVRYVCDSGYRIQGANERTCLSSGKWNGKIPMCIPVCPEPTSFNNGNVQYDGTSIGAIVRYVCDDGYSIQGANERTCLSSGKLNGEVPVCYPDCPEPTSFKNGKVQYDSTSIGSIVRYVCDNGYSIVGANEKTCLSSGKWDGEIPVCNPACKKPASPNNGLVKYSSTSDGPIAVYECEDNYGLEGKQTRKCQPTKRWEGRYPVCVPVYGPPLRAAMYVGARVQRGHDWRNGNQDGHGPGTVIRIFSNGGVFVDWDSTSGTYWYRLGDGNKYDIMFVPGTYDSSKAGQGQQ